RPAASPGRRLAGGAAGHEHPVVVRLLQLTFGSLPVPDHPRVLVAAPRRSPSPADRGPRRVAHPRLLLPSREPGCDDPGPDRPGPGQPAAGRPRRRSARGPGPRAEAAAIRAAGAPGGGLPSPGPAGPVLPPAVPARRPDPPHLGEPRRSLL